MVVSVRRLIRAAALLFAGTDLRSQAIKMIKPDDWLQRLGSDAYIATDARKQASCISTHIRHYREASVDKCQCMRE